MTEPRTTPLGKNVVIVAGAGTGKTYALVDEYVRTVLGRLFDGDEARSPERVLAVTFTEKAAAEMRSRVIDRLRTEGAPAAVQRDVVSAPLLTFHAFCARVLRDHALAADIDPRFTILEPHDERRLLTEIAESTVVDALRAGDRVVAELVARLGLRALGDRPALVECLVAVVESLAERGIAPRELALADVPPSARANDGADAASDATIAGANDGAPQLGAPHADVIVARHVDVVEAAIAAVRATGKGADRVAAIAQALAGVVAARADRDQEDPEAHIASAFTRLRTAAGGNWGGPNAADARRALVTEVERFGAALVDAQLAGLSQCARALIAKIHERARFEKNRRGELSFGDTLVRARDLLRDVPSVRARVASRYDRVLVDEYQDTSPIQEDLLAFLSEEPGVCARVAPGERAIDKTRAHPGRVLVVGDPRQSIYSFRGADAAVLSRAVSVLTADPMQGERRDLSVSRRSTHPIVALASQVATHALGRGSFGVPASELVPLTALRDASDAPKPAASAGPTDVRSGGSAAPAGAATSIGTAGAHWIVDDTDVPALPPHEREALVIAAQLSALFATGASPNDVAILVRRSRAALPLARALGRVGVRADVVGGDGFWDRPEVSDLVCALVLSVDPTDEIALLALLRSAFVCARDDDVLALYERARTGDDARAGPQLTWTRVVGWCTARIASGAPVGVPTGMTGALDPALCARVQQLDSLMRSVRTQVFRGSLAAAIDLLLDEGRYAAAMAVEPDAAARAKNVEKLRALVAKSGAHALLGITRLAELLEDRPPEPVAGVRPDKTHDPLGTADAGAVRIMTIHQAKGLEFPIVVVADAGSGLRGESDDLAFDPLEGLAVTARGRPIAACTSKTASRAAPTAIQRVRRRLRDRSECELARLLYVALTRARDRVFVVGLPRRQGPTSLAGLLEIARQADVVAFDALLPRETVRAVLPPALDPAARTPGSVDLDDDKALLPPAAPRPGPRRVRASNLVERVSAQVPLELRIAEQVDAVDEERLPPRIAGRLAHAVIALVATEYPDLVVGTHAGPLTAALGACARALGVNDAPADLLARCARTLTGPIARAIHTGAQLTFEERLRWPLADVVVEGRADLIVRTHDEVTVVELKLSPQRASAAELQAAAYAAALVDHGEARAVHVARWAIGDENPAASQRFTKALRARLDAAVHAIRV